VELKRVIAKDSRSALETINENYGENTVIIESNKVQGKIEMIVAVDINTESQTASKIESKDKTSEHANEASNDFETTLNKTIKGVSSNNPDNDMLTNRSIDS
jgi:flagellar biosynthesis GTPase FlhF